ncbi:MAG: serine/threonine protein kinase [Polyangiaceae bacterium]|nr:serine/threonine protein kinase [Polyangiaceae bacterium]
MSTAASARPDSAGGVRPGTVLAGRYVVEQRLGAGGFGQVFRARQEPLGRLVAIKVLLASAALSPDARERFTREAHLAMRLEHPNTVRVLDLGTTDSGLPFIVWELLRGETLGERIDARGRMSEAEVVRVTSQVLKSLMEAHALGVVHRDIKPANLFVTSHPGEELFVKVLDFGIAKDLASGEKAKTLHEALRSARGLSPSASPIATRESQALGTPRYMAPEQIAGETIGPAADLYAVGLVMAEMLTGRPVYDSDSALQLLLDRASGSRTPLPEEVVRSRLYPVIAKATSKQPYDRQGSAGEMLAALGSDLAANDHSARPAPSFAAPPGRTDVSASSLDVVAPSPATLRDPSISAGVTRTALQVTPTASGPIAHPAKSPRRGLRSLAIATAITIPLVAALVLVLVRLYGGEPNHSAKPKRSVATSKTAAPLDAVERVETAAPSIPIEGRAIKALSIPEIKTRIAGAGFGLQSEPTETTSELGRFINAPVVRGECFGAVHYYDYRDPNHTADIERSMKSLAASHAMHRNGARMVMVTITGRLPSVTSACERDLLDHMTR